MLWLNLAAFSDELIFSTDKVKDVNKYTRMVNGDPMGLILVWGGGHHKKAFVVSYNIHLVTEKSRSKLLLHYT